MKNKVENRLTLREIVNIPFKYKKLIGGVFLVSLAMSIIYCVLADPIYNAEAKFVVRLGKERLTPISVMPQTYYNVLLQERSENVQDEVEILKSPHLVYQILPHVKSKLDEIEFQESKTFKGILNKPFKMVQNSFQKLLVWSGIIREKSFEDKLFIKIRSAIKVSFQEDSNVVKLGFRWNDPEFAAYVLNLYTNAYIRQRNSMGSGGQSFEFYESQIRDHEVKLKEIEDKILDFQKRHVIAETSKQKEILLSEQERILAKLQDISLRLSELEVKKAEILRLLKSSNDWIETPNVGVPFTDLTSLDRKYFELKNQLDGLLLIFTPKAKEVIHVKEQIKELRKQKADSLINVLSIEMSNLRDQKAKLEAELEKNKEKLNALVQKELEYAQLQREKKVIEDNYLLYKKKAEEMRIARDIGSWNVASVELVAPAIPPVDPYWPKKKLIILVTAFVSLAFGLIVAFIKDIASPTFERANDFAKIGIDHIVTIPEIDTLRRT